MDNLVFVGTLVAHIASTAVNGIIEAKGGDWSTEGLNKLRESLRQYRPDANHEIQTAVYRAYLQATLQTCALRGEKIGMNINWCVSCELLPKILAKAEILSRKAANLIDPSLPSIPRETEQMRRQWYRQLPKQFRDKFENAGKNLYETVFGEAPQQYLLTAPRETPKDEKENEREWIDKVKDEYIELLTSLEEGTLKFPTAIENETLNELLGETGLLMQPKDGKEREKVIRESLLRQVEDELNNRFGKMPADFKQFFDENWFNYFCGCFQYQLGKKNSPVTIKFQSHILANVDAKQDQLIRVFAQFSGEMFERLQGLEKEISWISKEQREGFERIESLLISALPLIATIDDEAARTKLLTELRPEFQRVIDELSKTILDEGAKGRATTIEQSEKLEGVFREEVGELSKKVDVLIAVQANRDPSDPQALLHELPINESIEGREKECADLFAAMCEDGARVLCFTAPGGFGKTALLSKLVLEIADETQTKIIEPSINAFLHLDCRNVFKVFDFFSKMGRLIGRKDMFEQFVNLPDEQLSLKNKLEQGFAALSADGKKIWIALDNFETMLDDKNDIINDEVNALFEVCFAGNHRVRLLLASRHAPNVSNTDKAKFRLLSDIGKSLFDGLPLDNCVNYLRERGAARGLKGSEEEQKKMLETFAAKVHRMPMALKWAVGYLNDLNGDDEIITHTIEDLLNKQNLFDGFEQEQSKYAEDYKNKGLKRLHYEQLKQQSNEALKILHLLSRWNRPVPLAAFEHLMEEATLSKTLSRLTKNRLLSLRESQNLHIQIVGTPSMKNHYALHPVICENDFFKEPLQKDADGNFKQNEIAYTILVLHEITANVYWQKAMAAYYQNYFAHAFALFECAELVFEYLSKEQKRKDLENSHAAMLMHKGEALLNLGRLNDAIVNHNLAINIRKQLVEDEGRKELANDLAKAYGNKGNALRGLGRLNDAIVNHNLAINILLPLVEDEGRKELANDLAAAYMNKGNALLNLGRLNDAIVSYDLAINILLPLVEDEGRKELANDLAAAYMNKGNVLGGLGRLNDAIVSYDLAINILLPLVEDEGRKELANDLAAAYMNKGNALLNLGRLNDAIVSYDLAINIRKQLVEDEGRKELANDLAAAYINKGNALLNLGRLNDAIVSYDLAINILLPLVEDEGRKELANDLAKAYINKGVALDDLGRLNDAIVSYDLAINILLPLVEDEGRKELANDLAAAYMNKGNALLNLGRLNDAIVSYDLAINIRKQLVEDEGRKELANDLAAAYMNKGNALRGLGRLNDAIVNHNLAINIRKQLVEDEGRIELADDLAKAFANKANVLAEQENFKDAIDCFDAAENLWITSVQTGLTHLLPKLMMVIRLAVGMLLRVEDWNATAVKVLHAFMLLQFTMENDIHEAIKQNTRQESTRLLYVLCQTSQENREKIYEALGENADVIRETVEGFCSQMGS